MRLLTGPWRLAAAVPVAALVVGLAACQPVEEIDDLGDAPDAGVGADDADLRGAPAVALPTTLAEALERAEGEAVQWQAGARLAEVVVAVTEDGKLAEGRLTYLAPDADRILAVGITPEGISRQRPTLATLGLTPIPGAAVEALPPLPEGTREPAELATAAEQAFAGCGVDGRPETVLYATGAPLAWNPDTEAWATPLGWTATVTTEGGAGAVLDPVAATVLDCLPQPG